MDDEKRSRSVAEEMKREQTFWKRNNLWALLLFCAVLIYSFLSGPGLSVVPGATEVKLTLHDDNTVTIPYDSITAAELVDNAEYGEMLNGKEAKNGKSGTWVHSEWGNYTLCVYTASLKAVRIESGEKIYLISMGSDTDTYQLYQTVLDNSSDS